MGDRGYRVGLAQILVEGGRPDANLCRAEGAIGRAAAEGCRLVVLPECLDLGWTDPSARDLARPIPGPHSGRLARAAEQHRIYVAAGLVERAGDRLFNAAVLIDPEGRIRLHHRKINELDIALDLRASAYQTCCRDRTWVRKSVLSIPYAPNNVAKDLVGGGPQKGTG
jgi:predicted amidohydrolase